MKPYDPIIHTDGGPWAEHDMPCPVFVGESAVLNLASGRFQTSHHARECGWRIIRAPKWVWFILKFLPHQEP